MQDRTMQDPTMEERRKAARNRSLLQGKILINDRRSVIDCVVHNLSQHGACLRVASLIGIPPAFELQIGDETATRQCVAIWHSDARIGVEGPFKIGLNEVRIGLTMPLFVIELARHRLAPAHFDRAIISAVMYEPGDAVTAGFLDRAVAPADLGETCAAAAEDLAGLSPEAHAATKLRARRIALAALHEAIEIELPAA